MRGNRPKSPSKSPAKSSLVGRGLGRYHPGKPWRLKLGRLLAVVALVSMLAGGPAAAAIDSARVSEARKAAAAFLALAKNSHRTGQVPRQSDPAVKALIDKTLDTAAIDKGVAFGDIPRIEEWMAAGQKVAVVYLLAGTGAADLAKLSTDQKTLQRINRNIAEFQTEYGRYTDFQVAMAGAMLDAVQSRLDAASPKERDDPKTKSGLAGISARVTQTLIGVVSTFLTDGISDEWRRARSERLTGIASRTKILSAADAGKLRATAMSVHDAMKDAAVKASMKSFADALAR